MNAASNHTSPEITAVRLRKFFAKRLTLATFVAFVAVFVFARFSAEFNEQGKLQAFDRAVLSFCATHRYLLLYDFAWWVSWLSRPGCQVVVVGVAVLLFTLKVRFWPQGGTVLIAALGGSGIIAGLKYLFHRPRPEKIFAVLGLTFP